MRRTACLILTIVLVFSFCQFTFLADLWNCFVEHSECYKFHYNKYSWSNGNFYPLKICEFLLKWEDMLASRTTDVHLGLPHHFFFFFLSTFLMWRYRSAMLSVLSWDNSLFFTYWCKRARQSCTISSESEESFISKNSTSKLETKLIIVFCLLC